MEREDLNRKVDLAFLSAFYGGMLTEKQRRVLSLHCEEDLSLLGVAARFRRMESGLESALDALHRNDSLRAEQLLNELLSMETE